MVHFGARHRHVPIGAAARALLAGARHELDVAGACTRAAQLVLAIALLVALPVGDCLFSSFLQPRRSLRARHLFSFTHVGAQHACTALLAVLDKRALVPTCLGRRHDHVLVQVVQRDGVGRQQLAGPIRPALRFATFAALLS